jgi:CRP-like cAMP-binding protein
LRPDDRRTRLKSIAIFAELDDAVMAAIESLCRWRDYPAGAAIIGYLDRSDEVHFLAAGKARAIIYSAGGDAVLFKDILPGEMFGEIAALDEGPRSAGVEAVEPCVTASLSARAFRQVLADHPAVAAATLRRLTAQVRRLSERVHEFSTLGVQSRIRAELLRLAALAGIDQNQALLHPAPSLSELASRVSTHREAVSRELSRLAAMGVVTREKGALRIADVRRLKQLVREAKGE